MTKTEVKKRLRGLTDEQAKEVVCALVGHSRIQTHCFGYYNCSRCGAQVGDLLGGAYTAADVVVVGHNCPTCRKNFAALKWQDKFMTPDPFKVEVA